MSPHLWTAFSGTLGQEDAIALALATRTAPAAPSEALAPSA
jgi:hypothetical protein